MKSIACIHTVERVATTFAKNLQMFIGEEIKIHNLWDDFLANNPNEVGMFTVENRNRLFYDIKSAELTHSDLIVVTCSTLTPIVSTIRPFIKVPIIAIDDELGVQAVKYGEKIFVLATAESTLQPTEEKLLQEAKKSNKLVHIEKKAVVEAFKALKCLDMKTHDELLLKEAASLKGYDCIVLAQASMAHLEDRIKEICECPVLSSPKLCMQQIKRELEYKS